MPLLTLLGNKASGVTLGGTSQIGAFSSTGGIVTERTLGDASQIAAFTSTGGITLERALGGISQLGVFTSTGFIQVGDVVETLGGGSSPSKRKKIDQKRYEQAVEIALLNRKKEKARIEAAVEAVRQPEVKKKLLLKPKSISKPEIKQIASIDDSINRMLAIEYHLQRLDFKRREDEALAILLLLN